MIFKLKPIIACALLCTALIPSSTYAQDKSEVERDIHRFYELYMIEKQNGGDAIVAFLNRHLSEDIKTYLEVVRKNNGAEMPLLKKDRTKSEYITAVDQNKDLLHFLNPSYKIRSINISDDKTSATIRVSFSSDFTVHDNQDKGVETVICRENLDLTKEIIIVNESACYTQIEMD